MYLKTLSCEKYFVNITIFIVSFNSLINKFWREFWLVILYITEKVNVTILIA